MRKPTDLVGQRFGSLTVLRMLPRVKAPGGKLYPPRWECKCDCGNAYEAYGNYLTSGAATCCQQCGNDKVTAPIVKLAVKCPWPCNACEGQLKFGICCHECVTRCDNRCQNKKAVCAAYLEEKEVTK